MHKQVSRLRFILLGRLPATQRCSGLSCPFVRFTVTGVARSFHPYSLGRNLSRQRFFKRRCTRYSFAFSIIGTFLRVNVNSCAFGGIR